MSLCISQPSIGLWAFPLSVTHLRRSKSMLKRTAVYKLALRCHAAIFPISLIEPKGLWCTLVHSESSNFVPVCGQMCLYVYTFFVGWNFMCVRLFLQAQDLRIVSVFISTCILSHFYPPTQHPWGQRMGWKEKWNTRSILAIRWVVPLKALTHYCNGVWFWQMEVPEELSIVGPQFYT